MSGPVLELHGIRKRFGATVALDGVDFDIGEGEVHALVGENGAGKSTLMKILSGVHGADGGAMHLDGRPYAPAGPLEARRAGVVMVNQELAIAPHMSVAENIVLGAEPGRAGFVNHKEARRIAGDALSQLGRDDIPLGEPAGNLTVGEQQLVEVARALALGCRVLVLDEPTSSLGQADTEKLFALVRRLREQGRSVIYISHFLEEVQELSDRYTVLRDGRSVATGQTSDVTMERIAELMVGRQVNELYVRSARQPGEVVLEVRDLAGPLRATSVSLGLRRGEVLGIAGLVGAGRSELLRVIFGLEAVKNGSVRVGVHAGPMSPLHRWKHGTGMVSKDRKSEGLALDLPIEHNLTLPRLETIVSPGALAEETRKWIDRLEVRCEGPSQSVGNLSGGNQQKVALGRLLRNESDVLLLDEPTRGVDIGAKQNIYRLIDELACSGKAVLVVSSYLPELLGSCDRIAVMCRGVLREAKPAAGRTEHEIMLEATGTS